VPELRARFLDEQTQGIEQIAHFLTSKRRTAVDDLSLRVVGSALLAAVTVALARWRKHEGKRDLLALLDQATDAPAEGATDLRRSRAGAKSRGLPRQEVTRSGIESVRPSERKL